MNNDNKPSFLRVGTPACGAFMALLGAVLALLLVDILHLSAASYVPFIYFQF